MADKRRVTAEDLYDFHPVTDPQISPDGRHIIYCVQRVDKKTEKKYTNLWLVPTAGGIGSENGEPRQFTFGDHVDRHPRWSPDGKQIAFLSNRKDEKQFQLYLIPFYGGEARPVTTDIKGQFGGFAWSPDGSRFAVHFRKKDAEAIAREEDEQKKKLGEVARHYNRVFYKADGAGWLPQERWHIWTVDAGSGEAAQLTDGLEYEENMPTWSPDGATLLFAANRAENPDFEPDTMELYTIPAGGGDLTHIEITGNEFQKFSPSYSPDGNWIAYRGREMAGNFWQNTCLYVVPAGGGAAMNLTQDHDLHLGSMTNGDIVGSPEMTPLQWSPDSRAIFFSPTYHGVQPYLAINRQGGKLQHLIEDGVNGPFSRDDAGRFVAYVHQTMTNPGEIWVYDHDSGESRLLTGHNHELLAQLELGTLEAVKFNSADGTELDGWILKPPGFDPAGQYPSIMEIHGGPQTQYGHAFMHEFFYLAAHDYVVYFSNPRGSQGYGNGFAGAIHNNWGTVDYEDIMAWADYMEQQPYIDPTRMGVTGGSYGGYMTIVIIGRTNRFKAACAQRLVSNLISMWGSSDFNWVWTRAWNNETPWENLNNYWRQSPISQIGNATTPTLIIHSEKDFRANLEQGEQVYVALKKLGVDTEMVVFPDEPHGLSRTGRTDRRIARLEHILRWFEKYLK